MKRHLLVMALGAGLFTGCASNKTKFEEPPQAEVPAPPPPAPVVNRVHAETPYRFPLVSIGAKFSTLPPAVQNTIRAEVGTLPLADVVKDTTSGTTVYKILFENETLFPPLLVAPDGAVLNPDLTIAVAAAEENIGVPADAGAGLKTSELPPPVMKTILSRAPSGEIMHIAKETWGTRDIYIISFKDPTHNPRLYIAADGSLAGGSHRP